METEEHDIYTQECNLYDLKSHLWEPATSRMWQSRGSPASVMIDETQWWITGTLRKKLKVHSKNRNFSSGNASGNELRM